MVMAPRTGNMESVHPPAQRSVPSLHATMSVSGSVPGRSGVENAVNALTLASGLVLAAIFAWAIRTHDANRAPISDVATATPQWADR